MTQTVRLEDDVYAAVLQVSLELSQKENRRVNMGEAIRMIITFCPAVDKSKLKVPLKLY